jgi:hypothetical protein
MSHGHRQNQQGAAIIIVLLLGLIAIALVSAMMLFASTSTPLARNDQNWNGSLASAEAGIDDYLYRLSKDSSYWQKSTDATNAALVPAGATTSLGEEVPGGSTESRFRYSVTPPSVTLNGTIKLRVTGLVRKSKRTVEATLRRDGFLDYLYFSKFETVDPDSYASSPQTKAWADANCKDRYAYQIGNPGDPLYTAPRDTTGDNSTTSPTTWACNEIVWVTGDTLDGPLHTNDALRISGNPVFKKMVTTSWAKTLTSGSPSRWNGSGSPQFQGAENQAPSGLEKNNPIIKSRLDPPADNSELEADALLEGCVYKGPTWIKLHPAGSGNLATWDVVSPGTPFTSDCGGGSSTATTNIDGPANFNGVIYVSNLTTCTAANHPNSGYPYPLGLPVPIKETITTGLTLARATDITAYSCTAGDAFVEGTLNGQLTIGAKSNIVVTKHIKYANTTASSDDVLGLITNNYLEVIHPVRCTNCPVSGSTAKSYQNINGYWDANAYSTSSDRDPTIYAAMLSTKHSFRVQNWTLGAQPGSSSHLLHIIGAIAQIYRCPVGTSSGTGFFKDYKYDDRLKLISPPHFLDPVQSAWKVKTWAEVKS